MRGKARRSIFQPGQITCGYVEKFTDERERIDAGHALPPLIVGNALLRHVRRPRELRLLHVRKVQALVEPLLKLRHLVHTLIINKTYAVLIMAACGAMAFIYIGGIAALLLIVPGIIKGALLFDELVHPL